MVTITTDVDLCWALNPGPLEEEETKALVRRAISLAPNVTSFLSVYLFMCVQVGTHEGGCSCMWRPSPTSGVCL